MGGTFTIETIRPGVQFTPEAASAFRRAEAQVQSEFGRNIDVNSTYRDRDLQLRMYNAWQAYIRGAGPYPGHSKALHPDDPLAFHTKGTALDSDDWVNGRVVEILAENGFIRNRLYVPNERHHFEYLRDRDRNYGKPASGGNSVEDDMFTDEDRDRQKRIEAALVRQADLLGGSVDSGTKVFDLLRSINSAVVRLTKVLGGSVKTDGNLNGDNVITRLRKIGDKLSEKDKS